MRYRDPIAITGIGLRVPGADGADALWANLLAGKDFSGRTGHDRPHVLSGDERLAGFRGGWLTDIAAFDAGFFGISEGEAVAMDPQQRLLLHTTEAAFRDAQLPARRRRSLRSGVWTSQIDGHYWDLVTDPTAHLDIYDFIGSNLQSGTAGRIASAFDLRGPAVSVDASCASLIVLDVAALALAADVVDVAVVGGVNLVLYAPASIGLSGSGKVLSPDGRAKFGSALANGYGRSEGVITVILRRLSDAQAAGEPIRAVILGASVRHPGSSRPMFSPSATLQHEMLAEAYDDAGVALARVDYIEAHGTGTVAGDRAELTAIGELFQGVRTPVDPLPVGSVKTAIGHLESGAGLAGLVKAILVAQHRMVPGSPLVGAPSALLTSAPHLHRVTETVSLATDRPIVGVSSFGVTGVTSHMVLSAAPYRETGLEPQGPHVLPISAHTPQTLLTTVGAFRELLAGPRPPSLASVCTSAAHGRDHHRHRLAVVATDAADAARQLEVAHPGPGGPPPRIIFVFPGQGGQYPGMARSLRSAEPVFAAALAEADAAVRELTGWSIAEILASGDDLTDTLVAQSAIFAVEYALQSMWRWYGVEPDLMIGHSLGEVAAAVAAGALSVRQGATVVVERAKAAAELGGGGTMIWVGLGASDTAHLLDPFPGLSIAARNSPNSTIVAGNPDQAERLLTACADRDVGARRVKAAFASHSSAMIPAANLLEARLRALTPAPVTVPLRSTITGELCTGHELTASHWAAGLVQPVAFSEAIAAELAAGPAVFVEVGPHPVLLSAIGDQPSVDECVLIPSLRHDVEDELMLRTGIAALYTAGADVNWTRHTPQAAPAALPGPFWQTRRCWKPATTQHRHPLLGEQIQADAGQLTWQRTWTETWPALHLVGGRPMLPASAYLHLVVAAARELVGPGPVGVEDLILSGTVILDEPPMITTSLYVEDDMLRITIEVGKDLRTVATATAMPGRPDPAPPTDPPIGPMSPGGSLMSGDDFYALINHGNNRSGPFRSVRAITQADGWATADISNPERLAHDKTNGVPLTDACMQAILGALPGGSALIQEQVLISRIDRVHQYLPMPDDLVAEVHLSAPPTDRQAVADVRARSQDGELISELIGVHLRAMPDPVTHELYRTVYREYIPPAPRPGADRWLLLADQGRTAAQLAATLRNAGADVTVSDALSTGFDHVIDCRSLDRTADPATNPAAEALALTSALIDAVKTGLDGRPFWLLTRNAIAATGDESHLDLAAAALWGAGQALQWERPGETLLVDLDDTPASLATLAALLRSGTTENQLALREGDALAARFRRAPSPARSVRRAKAVTMPHPGRPHDFTLEQAGVRSPRPDEVTVRVTHAGITRNHTPSPQFSGEFTGQVSEIGRDVTAFKPGRRIIGWTEPGAGMATHLTVPAELCAAAPDDHASAACAAFPLAYATAYRALVELSGLDSGQTVLIHHATGLVGQAAIAIARWRGATVFATAETSGQRAELAGLSVAGVADSRTRDLRTAFPTVRDVDVILDMGAEPAKETKLELLADDGIYVMVAEQGAAQAPQVSVALLGSNRQIAAVDLHLLRRLRPDQVGRTLRVVSELLITGALPALPYRCLPAEGTAEPFPSKQVQKLVMAMPDDIDPVVRADGTYLVTGGLGAIGRAAARWLAAQGAGEIILTGRSPAAADPLLDELRRSGAVVDYLAINATDQRAWQKLIEQRAATGRPPIRGLFHTAGTAPTAAPSETTAQHLQEAFDGKANGAWALHRALEAEPLDFFAMTSSVVSTLGCTPIGTNLIAYAAANAFCDGLGHLRRIQRRPATVVNWGYWTGGGMITRAELKYGRSIVPAGISRIEPEDAMQLFGLLLTTPEPQTTVSSIDWARFLAAYPSIAHMPLLADVLAELST